MRPKSCTPKHRILSSNTHESTQERSLWGHCIRVENTLKRGYGSKRWNELKEI